MKEIKQETDRPKGNLPYQDVNRPFRMQFVVPGPGITIEQDKNGILYISAQGGSSVSNIIAGDNIEIEHRENGSVVISAVNSVANISAGENVTITVDPETGTSVINSIIGGETNEHYKGVFDTTEDLIAADPDPEIGDYGLIKSLTITNGETSWSGQYKYCFFINGAWTVVDQMLTFTKNLDLLQQYYSVGGSSPVIYLHEIARSGNFWDLNNIPIVATPEVTVDGTTVTVTCATEGAVIWYTTDGSMPHVNGTKYTGPITASGATTFRFVAIKNGMINSLEATASADYELQAPLIELDWHTGEISMTNPNNNGSIYYTTDGSTPTNLSTLYTGPFVITDATTFKLIVIYNSLASAVSEQAYQKLKVTGGVRNLSPSNGKINVNPGVVGYENNVQVNTAILTYTLNGSDPTFSSDVFTEAVQLDNYGGIKIVKEKAFMENCVPSDVRATEYGALKPVSPPIIFDAETNTVSLCNTHIPASNVMAAHGLVDGMFGGSQGYVFFFPQGNTYSRIYYTLDGSTPTDQSTLYTGPFQVSGNVTVKAVLVAYGQYYSDVATENVTVLAPPQISFGLDVPTTFDGLVTLTNPNNAGEIRYTTDGSTPTAESPLYSSVIHLSQTKTVKAIVVDNGAVSAVAEQTFTQLPAAQYNDSVNYSTGLETISVIPQSYNGMSVGHYVGLFLSAGHQELYPYTLVSGSYSKPEMKLFGPYWEFVCYSVLDGYIPKKISYVDGGLTPDAPTIGYDGQGGPVTFSRGNNTTLIPLQTNNNTPELGCRVYYTLDGSTPDDTSTLWDGNPVPVEEGATVKAVCVVYGEYYSGVAELVITVRPEPLKLTMPTGGTVILRKVGDPYDVDLEVSTNGILWEPWEINGTDYSYTLQAGQTLCIRRANAGTGVSSFSKANNDYWRFIFEDPVSASGSIMSLVSNDCSELDLSGKDLIFSDLFNGCETLTTAPELPAKILPYGAYRRMFEGCTNLVIAPTISATTIGYASLFSMFNGCTSLVNAPEISVKEMGIYSLAYMFGGCTSLVNAPVLLSEVVAEAAYGSMFAGCTILSCVKTCMTDVSANDCLTSWLLSVNGTGDFYCPKDLVIGEGASGIPSGWTRHDITELWWGLKLTMPEGGTVILRKVGDPYDVDLEVSTNGILWEPWEIEGTDYSYTLQAGQTLCIRRANAGTGVSGFSKTSSDYWRFIIEDPVSASGSIMSLVSSDSTDLDLSGESFVFNGLFYGCETLTTAPELPATTLSDHCYRSLFLQCRSLSLVHDLPAEVLQPYCYESMFRGCTSLVDAPAISATTLADHSCYYMFGGCTSLVNAPALLNTTTSVSCFSSMFRGCTSLVNAPVLLSEVVTNAAYYYMFAGCTSLSYVKTYMTDVSANNSLNSWLSSVNATGDFYCPQDLVIEEGASGIPSGWTRHAI